MKSNLRFIIPRKTKLLSLPLSIFLAINSFGTSAETTPVPEEYNIICYQSDCNSLQNIKSFINGQPEKEFNDADVFYIYDNNVIVNSTTYADYLIEVDKFHTISKRDAALNCSFDSDYSCSDWKNDPSTRALVNYIQNVQWNTAPLTNIQVQIDSYLHSLGVSIAVGSLLAIPVVGVESVSVILIRIGGQFFAKVVGNSVSGVIGTTIAFGLDLQTASKFLPGDVLIFQNGKVVKVIRNGKEIDIKDLPAKPTQTGGGGGVDSGGGTTGGGGIVGGGGSGGGKCFVNCGSVYIRDEN